MPGQNMPGQCRHDPPRVFMLHVQQPPASPLDIGGRRVNVQQPPQVPPMLSVWPPVGPDGWCWAHEKIDPVPSV